MSKLKGSLFGLTAAGSIGQSITYARVRGATIVKKIPTHVDANTFRQRQHRLLHDLAAAFWHSLTSAQQAVYETNARPSHMTGWALFLQEYITDKPNLQLVLPFEAGPGNPLVDKSPNAIIPAQKGPSWTPAEPGYALSFDGSDDRVNCTNNPALNFTTSPFSILAVIKPDSPLIPSYPFNRGFWNADGYLFSIRANGSFEFYTFQLAANQSAWTAAGHIQAHQWQTILMTRNGANGLLYHNGQDVTTFSQALIAPQTSVRNALVGIADDLLIRAFAGQIHSVVVWSTAVTPTQALRLHEKFSSKPFWTQ